MKHPSIAAAMGLAAGLALCGCHPDRSAAPPAAPATQEAPVSAAAVDAQRLARREPDQWLTLGGDSMGTYYSPLKDIDAGNVARLNLNADTTARDVDGFR